MTMTITDTPFIRATTNRVKLIADLIDAKRDANALKKRINAMQQEVVEIMDKSGHDEAFIGSRLIKRSSITVAEHVRPTYTYDKIMIR